MSNSVNREAPTSPSAAGRGVVTLAALHAKILADNASLADVVFERKGEGQFVAHLHFHWYALELFRGDAYDRARSIIEENKDAGMTVLVAVW